jgi:hypothetical protein
MEKLARATGLSRVVLEAAETPRKVVPIRMLELLAQHLALDERRPHTQAPAPSPSDLVADHW